MQMTAIKSAEGLRAAKNETGTDIDPYHCIILDTTEDQVALTGGGTASTAGVTTETFVNTDDCYYTYQVSGRAICRASAAVITAGDLVMPDNAGHVLTRTGTNSIVGRAVNTCAASGLVMVDLMLQKGA